ncbi:MAG TPA: DUF456 domain-containing protein [Gemmatimonadales bacterium]|nr:DUF456 domain-containing protein [Gemmatimonadales bacterium]
MIGLVLAAAALIGLALTAIGLPGLWLFLLVALGLAAGGVAGAPSLAAIGIGFGLAFLAEIGEWAASVRWTRRSGGSRRAGWGALLGGLTGAIVGLPVPVIGSVLGSFAGSFLGALAAEYSVTGRGGTAGRVAWGALVGRVVATAVKMALGFIAAVVIIASTWR